MGDQPNTFLQVFSIEQTLWSNMLFWFSCRLLSNESIFGVSFYHWHYFAKVFGIIADPASPPFGMCKKSLYIFSYQTWNNAKWLLSMWLNSVCVNMNVHWPISEKSSTVSVSAHFTSIILTILLNRLHVGSMQTSTVSELFTLHAKCAYHFEAKTISYKCIKLILHWH